MVGGMGSNRKAKKEASANREFQLYMSNTAHQREIQDLEKAGLNPILSGTGGGGASAPAGASATMQAPDMTYTAKAIGAGMTGGMDVMNTLAGLQQIKAQTGKTAAETVSAIEQVKNMKTVREGQEIANAKQAGLTPHEIKKAAAEKDPIALGAYRSQAEANLAAARIAAAKTASPADMKAAEEKKAADAVKRSTIDIIDKYITEDGKPKDILKRSTGFGSGVDRFLGGITIVPGGSEADELVAQDELIRGVVTDDVLKTVQLLKPASDTDVKAIQATRPGITTSPGQWAAYLSSIKNVMSKDIDEAKLTAPQPAVLKEDDLTTKSNNLRKQLGL